MSDWTAGYVTDIDYTYGYYVELNPLRLRLPFLKAGLVPPLTGTACELAFGQGVSTNLHAAASSARSWPCRAPVTSRCGSPVPAWVWQCLDSRPASFRVLQRLPPWAAVQERIRSCVPPAWQAHCFPALPPICSWV